MECIRMSAWQLSFKLELSPLCHMLQSQSKPLMAAALFQLLAKCSIKANYGGGVRRLHCGLQQLGDVSFFSFVNRISKQHFDLKIKISTCLKKAFLWHPCCNFLYILRAHNKPILQVNSWSLLLNSSGFSLIGCSLRCSGGLGGKFQLKNSSRLRSLTILIWQVTQQNTWQIFISLPQSAI